MLSIFSAIKFGYSESIQLNRFCISHTITSTLYLVRNEKSKINFVIIWSNTAIQNFCYIEKYLKIFYLLRKFNVYSEILTDAVRVQEIQIFNTKYRAYLTRIWIYKKNYTHWKNKSKNIFYIKYSICLSY